jgi:hypothetical protein
MGVSSPVDPRILPPAGPQEQTFDEAAVLDAAFVASPHFAISPPPSPAVVANATCAQQNVGSEEPMFAAGERVRVNLAGLKVKHVLFQAAVTDAVGDIVKKTSDTPPMYLVRLLFSFKGVDEVEVPEDRVRKF